MAEVVFQPSSTSSSAPLLRFMVRESKCKVDIFETTTKIQYSKNTQNLKPQICVPP